MPTKSSILPAAILLTAIALYPDGAAGQDIPDSTAVRLEVSADASLGLQRLGGATLGSIGGRLWLTFPSGWRLGVGGTRGIDRISGGQLEGSGLEAHFGAGSVSLAVPLPTVRGFDGLEGRFAVGSGAVHLDNALLGTTVDTETIWTLEPSIHWRGRSFGAVAVGGELGYRWVLGSAGLSRLDAADLRTFTLAVVVTVPGS